MIVLEPRDAGRQVRAQTRAAELSHQDGERAGLG
jgi:hypothetical protein